MQEMNERIKRIAEESGAGWDDKYHWYVGNEQMKKIAELIIQECADFIEKTEKYTSSPKHIHLVSIETRKEQAKAIRQHFGIEE